MAKTLSYSPWRELDEATNRLTSLFEGAGMRRNGGSLWSPPVNVAETAEEVVFTVELPGMREDQVSIELEQSVLTVSGEKVEERTEGEDERKYHLWERTSGSFRRSFTLPRPVNADEVTARFENGVLEIRLPKAPEAKGRKIEISKR